MYPDLPIQGVMLNVILRDRSSRSKYQPFERDTASRTEGQLQMFEQHHRLRMEQIERLKGRYRTLTDDYGDPWQAAQETFIATGTSTGACEDTYGRPCDFLDVCKGVGMESTLTEGFVAYKEAARSDGEDGDA
jgi:hypothetical protein